MGYILELIAVTCLRAYAYSTNLFFCFLLPLGMVPGKTKHKTNDGNNIRPIPSLIKYSGFQEPFAGKKLIG